MQQTFKTFQSNIAPEMSCEMWYGLNKFAVSFMGN